MLQYYRNIEFYTLRKYEIREEQRVHRVRNIGIFILRFKDQRKQIVIKFDEPISRPLVRKMSTEAGVKIVRSVWRATHQ